MVKIKYSEIACWVINYVESCSAHSLVEIYKFLKSKKEVEVDWEN